MSLMVNPLLPTMTVGGGGCSGAGVERRHLGYIA